MTTPTETPLAACPHCGAEKDDRAVIALGEIAYHCGTYGATRTDLCKEREKSQKLEAEVERLRAEKAELVRIINLPRK